jgi:hypothetical protein
MQTRDLSAPRFSDDAYGQSPGARHILNILITQEQGTMTKRNKIIYWGATLWLALGLVSTGAVQLLRVKSGSGALDSIVHLGYPVYLLTILGVWKMLGVVAVLIPKYPLVKEWAYAGIFFTMSGAIFSHIVSGDGVTELFPSIFLLILGGVSWYFRPDDRKTLHP